MYGYYVDYSYGDQYGRCIKCSAPCVDCSSANVCKGCMNGVLWNGGCRVVCPIAYYQAVVTVSLYRYVNTSIYYYNTDNITYNNSNNIYI
jgi:hypothetical protein